MCQDVRHFIDCKTVIYSAKTSDGKRRCVHIRTKGLERVLKRRGRMGRDAKKYAGVWGSRASHSSITLTALRAFQKRPKTAVLQSSHFRLVVRGGV